MITLYLVLLTNFVAPRLSVYADMEPACTAFVSSPWKLKGIWKITFPDSYGLTNNEVVKHATLQRGDCTPPKQPKYEWKAQ